MEAVVILLWVLAGIVAAIVVLGLVGLILTKRDAAKGKAAPPQTEVIPEKTLNNVLDVQDRFNRARYMDKDGK